METGKILEKTSPGSKWASLLQGIESTCMGQMLWRASGFWAAGFGLLEEEFCTAEVSSSGQKYRPLLYSAAKAIHTSEKNYFWYLFLKSSCWLSANNSTYQWWVETEPKVGGKGGVQLMKKTLLKSAHYW